MVLVLLHCHLYSNSTSPHYLFLQSYQTISVLFVHALLCSASACDFLHRRNEYETEKGKHYECHPSYDKYHSNNLASKQSATASHENANVPNISICEFNSVWVGKETNCNSTPNAIGAVNRYCVHCVVDPQPDQQLGCKEVKDASKKANNYCRPTIGRDNVCMWDNMTEKISIIVLQSYAK